MVARQVFHGQWRSSQRGFSLMEVLIALFIISIGLLGVAGLQSTLIKDGFDTAQRSQMIWLGQELVARMRANEDGQVSGYLNAAADGNLCDSGPVKYCSDYFDAGTGAKVNAAGDCSADEVAEFDIWELRCGYENAGANSNAMDNILITGIAVDCSDQVGGVCQPDVSTYTLTPELGVKSGTGPGRCRPDR